MNPIIAAARSTVAELRDQAAAHAATADDAAGRLTGPADVLEALAAEEADLVRRLESLREEMAQVRTGYDAIAAERDHHAALAGQKRATADYYEATTLPDLTRLLQAAPAGQAVADALDPPRTPLPEPRQVEPVVDVDQLAHWARSICAHCDEPIHWHRPLTRWTHTESKDTACRPDAPSSPVAEPLSAFPPVRAVPAIATDDPADYGHLRGRAVIVHLCDGTRTTGVLTGYDRDAVWLGEHPDGIPRNVIDDITPVPDPSVRALSGGDPLTTTHDAPAEATRHSAPRDSTDSGVMRAIKGGWRGLVHRDEQDGAQAHG